MAANRGDGSSRKRGPTGEVVPKPACADRLLNRVHAARAQAARWRGQIKVSPAAASGERDRG